MIRRLERREKELVQELGIVRIKLETERNKYAASLPQPHQPQPCGTPAAYVRHLRRAETPCAACKAAQAAYMAQYRRAAAEARNPCGTPAAEARHRRRGEIPCDPCRLAKNKYLREREQNASKG